MDFREIASGGVPKDGIRAIDAPVFALAADLGGLAGTEPVIGLIVNGEAKAYPLQISPATKSSMTRLAGFPWRSPSARCAIPPSC